MARVCAILTFEDFGGSIFEPFLPAARRVLKKFYSFCPSMTSSVDLHLSSDVYFDKEYVNHRFRNKARFRKKQGQGDGNNPFGRGETKLNPGKGGRR